MKRLAEILLLCVAVALLMGADKADARFQKIGSKIMCTCGSCSYMLLECNHVGCPNSTRMIAQLHALTGTGKLAGVEPQADDEAILEWFRKTWGVTAVVEPAKHGLELWAWIMPPAALAIGLVLVVFTIRKWKPSPAPASPQNAQLDPQFEALRDRARRETEI
jgi:Cytochrome C biogenesis protein